jgi:hypothetical protein
VQVGRSWRGRDRAGGATGSARRGSISERVDPRGLLGAYREDLLQCVSGWVEWYQSDLCQVGSFSDSVDLGVSIPRVSVADLLEFTDKNLNEGSSIQFCQNFINEVMDANGEADGVAEENKQLPNSPLSEPNGNAQVQGQASKNGDEKGELGPTSKIREDGFLLFKNLCKLSMKFSSQDQSDDQILLRGKVLSLELLKVVMENAGPLWRTDERQVIFCFDPIL